MKLQIDDISNYSDDDFDAMFLRMEASKKQRTALINEKDTKNLSILGDDIARRMISEISGIDKSRLHFREKSGGKPYCENFNVYFNISHSGTKAVCAVSDKETGIDIEINRARSFNTVKRFATESEIEFISDSIDNFYKIWCLKEAYVKCTGEGIRNNLKNVEFTVNDNNVLCSDINIRAWLDDSVQGYTIAICEIIK